MHISVSVRGALKNATKRELAAMFVGDDGRRLTADQAKDHLMELLCRGTEVMPVGAACEGFDYKGKGCPGHAQPTKGEGERR